MSLEVSSNRILVTKDGITKFDTSSRHLHFQSKTSFSFTIPAVPTGTNATEIDYLVGTLPYNADFILGTSSIQGGAILNGSNIIDFTMSIAALALVCLRTVTLYVNGKNIYAKVGVFNLSGASISSRTFSVTVLAGNYDT